MLTVGEFWGHFWSLIKAELDHTNKDAVIRSFCIAGKSLRYDNGIYVICFEIDTKIAFVYVHIT